MFNLNEKVSLVEGDIDSEEAARYINIAIEGTISMKIMMPVYWNNKYLKTQLGN